MVIRITLTAVILLVLFSNYGSSVDVCLDVASKGVPKKEIYELALSVISKKLQNDEKIGGLITKSADSIIDDEVKKIKNYLFLGVSVDGGEIDIQMICAIPNAMGDTEFKGGKFKTVLNVSVNAVAKAKSPIQISAMVKRMSDMMADSLALQQ